MPSKTRKARGPGRPAVYPELGVTGLKRYSGFVQDEFLPELRGQRGMQIYREIRDNSAKVGAALGAAEMAALGVEWYVEPGENDTNAAERAAFVESCRHDMSFTWRETIREAWTMLPFGFAPLEIVYKRRSGDTADPRGRSRFDDGLISWRKLPLRAQETIQQWDFDDEGGIQGLYQLAPPSYQRVFIPIEKLLLFRTRTERNNPEGRSILRSSYESYYRVKRIKDTLCIGVERDLNGIPVMWVPPEVLQGATPDMAKAKTDYFTLVKNIRQDEQAGVVLPMVYTEGGHPLYKLELLATTGRRQFDLVATIEYFESCIAASLLHDLLMGGQSNTIQYRSAGDPGMFASAVHGWLDIICDTMNAHAIPRLYRANGWDTKSPARLRHGAVKAPDLTKLADFVSKLAPTSFLTPDSALERHFRRIAGLPEQDQAQPIVAPPEGDPEPPPPDDTDAELEPDQDPALARTITAGRRSTVRKGWRDVLLERLDDPRHLRLGEFARLTGNERDYVRKLVEAGTIATVPVGPKRERRITVAEARRFLGLAAA